MHIIPGQYNKYRHIGRNTSTPKYTPCFFIYLNIGYQNLSWDKQSAGIFFLCRAIALLNLWRLSKAHNRH